MVNSFNEKLIEMLNEIDVNIDEEKANLFKKYMDLLLEWNEKINLTAITEEDEIILKHFVDSLTIAKYLGENKKIIGSMTKVANKAKVNEPDLNGFKRETTFYVTYDESGNEHSTIPITNDPPKNWYNYSRI